MVQDDQDVRVSVRESRGVSHLGGVELKVKGEAKAPEQPKSAPPRVRPDQVGTVHVALCGIRMPIYGVANSANVLVAGVAFQDLLHVRRIQRRASDDPVRESRACRPSVAAILSRLLGSTDPIRISTCTDLTTFWLRASAQIVFQQVVLWQLG